MATQSIEQQLEERGAILRGHFQLASGRHADLYIEKFRILQWPDITGELCRGIAQYFAGKANIVAGPTTGGIILAYETARHLGLPSIIAERKDDGKGREFKRGFQVGHGDRVLVVDDVLTTGGSVRDVLHAVRARGAEPVGVGMLIDRTGGSVDFGVPFYARMTYEVQSWLPEECALCRQGVALTIT